MENQLTKVKSYLSILLRDNSNSSISTLTHELLNEQYYPTLREKSYINGQQDFSTFNDIEMIYIYVHQQKNIDKKKNRIEDTKKEYLRDLLITYRHLLEHIVEFDIPVDEITHYNIMKKLDQLHLEKYQTWLQTAPLGKKGNSYSPATLHRKTTIFKGYLSFLYANSYIDSPLHEKMLGSSVNFMDRPNRDLSSVEVLKLIKYFNQNPIVSSLLIVLALTGIRIRELCTARICDIAIDENGDYYLKVMGKGRKEREVLLLPEAMESICRFRKRRRQEFELDYSNETPIFTTAKGKAYNYKYLSNFLIQKINGADLDFIKAKKTSITPHFFRHMWAIESAEQGADLLKISQSLGHSDVKVTQIYLEKKQSRKNNASHTWKGSTFLKKLSGD